MADEPTTLRGIVEGIGEDVGDFTNALNFVLFDADSDQLITLAWLLCVYVFSLVLIYYFVKTLWNFLFSHNAKNSEKRDEEQ